MQLSFRGIFQPANCHPELGSTCCWCHPQCLQGPPKPGKYVVKQRCLHWVSRPCQGVLVENDFQCKPLSQTHLLLQVMKPTQLQNWFRKLLRALHEVCYSSDRHSYLGQDAGLCDVSSLSLEFLRLLKVESFAPRKRRSCNTSGASKPVSEHVQAWRIGTFGTNQFPIQSRSIELKVMPLDSCKTATFACYNLE